MLNFPTNPTGATMEAAELEKIAAVCIRHNLVVLTDEIYSELTYDGAGHTSIAVFPGMKERTVFLHGLSKAFAMTGWRIGFACAPTALIEAMMKIHNLTQMVHKNRQDIEHLFNVMESHEKARKRFAEEQQARFEEVYTNLEKLLDSLEAPKYKNQDIPDNDHKEVVQEHSESKCFGIFILFLLYIDRTSNPRDRREKCGGNDECASH